MGPQPPLGKFLGLPPPIGQGGDPHIPPRGGGADLASHQPAFEVASHQAGPVDEDGGTDKGLGGEGTYHAVDFIVDLMGTGYLK